MTPILGDCGNCCPPGASQAPLFKTTIANSIGGGAMNATIPDIGGSIASNPLGFGQSSPFVNDPVINLLSYTAQDAVIVASIFAASFTLVFDVDQSAQYFIPVRRITANDIIGNAAAIFSTLEYPGILSPDGLKVWFPPVSIDVSSFYNLANGASIQYQFEDELFYDGGAGQATESATIVTTPNVGTNAVNYPYQFTIIGLPVPA